MPYDTTIDEKSTGYPSGNAEDYQDAADWVYYTKYGDQPFVLAEGATNAAYGIGGSYDFKDFYSLGVLYAGSYTIHVECSDWFTNLENGYDLAPGSLDLWAYNSDPNIDANQSAGWGSASFGMGRITNLDLSLANPWLSFNNPPYRDYARISFSVVDPIHLQVEFNPLAGNGNLWDKEVAYKVWYAKSGPTNKESYISEGGVPAVVEGSSAIGEQVVIDSLLGDDNGVSDGSWNLNHTEISFLDPVVTWYADGTEINRDSDSVSFNEYSFGTSGPFEAALTTTLAEAGKEITAKVSFTDSAGYREEVLIESGIVIDKKVIAYDGAFDTIEILELESDLPIGMDYSGDPLTYSAGTTGPSHGSVEIQSDGSFVYQADFGYVGTDSFTYVVSDGDVVSDEATVAVDVKDGNVAPVAKDATYTTDEESVLKASAPAATDPDNLSGYVESDPLTYVLGSVSPLSGTLNFESDGSFTYDPAKDFAGSVTFSYKAYDTALYSTEATITINVSNVNDLPVAHGAFETIKEDTVLEGTLPAVTDLDPGDTHTYQAGSLLPSHGSVSIDPDGTYQYTPDADFYGSDSFGYVVSDGTGLSNQAIVAITVDGVDDFPGVSAEVDIRNGAAPGTLVYSNNLLDPEDNFRYSLANPSDSTIFSVNELSGDVYLSDVALADGKRNLVHEIELVASIDDRVVHEYTVQATVLAFDDQIGSFSSYVTPGPLWKWAEADLSFLKDGSGFVVAYKGLETDVEINPYANHVFVDVVKWDGVGSRHIDIMPSQAWSNVDDIHIATSPDSQKFAVTWSNYVGAGTDTYGRASYAQVFDLSGGAESSVIHVSPQDRYQSPYTEVPLDIEFLSNSTFFTLYDDDSVANFGRIYATNGSELSGRPSYIEYYGSPVGVVDPFNYRNGYGTDLWVRDPQGTTLARVGDQLIAVASDHYWVGSRDSIVIAIMDGELDSFGLPFYVSEDLAQIDLAPRILELTNGDFAVYWSRKVADYQTNKFVRILGSDGAFKTGEINLSSLTGEDIWSLASDYGGGFFIDTGNAIQRYRFSEDYASVTLVSEVSAGPPNNLLNRVLVSDAQGHVSVKSEVEIWYSKSATTVVSYDFDVNYQIAENFNAPDITTTRVELPESVAAGAYLAQTIEASDADGDPLQYVLLGYKGSSPAGITTFDVPDGLFEIEETTGQIKVLFQPEFESISDSYIARTFLLDVLVTDGELADRQSILVSVTDVDEAPVFLNPIIDENGVLQGWSRDERAPDEVSITVNGVIQQGGPVHQALAEDLDSDTPYNHTIEFELGGPDAELFALDTSARSATIVAKESIPYAGDATYQVLLTARYNGLENSQVVNISTVNHAPTGGVTITGTAELGQTLEASDTLDDIDGLGEISYQWACDGVAIANASGSQYVLTADDIGAVMTVIASYTDAGGVFESLTSAPTPNVARGYVPVYSSSHELIASNSIRFVDEVVGQVDVALSDFSATGTRIVSAELTEATAGAVDISDVISQLRHIVGLSTLSGLHHAAADNDANGTVDIGDVINSLRQIVELEPAPNARVVNAEGQAQFLFDDSVTELFVVAAGDADLSWTPLELL